MQTGTLLLIRHAPVAEQNRLCGRTDLPARIDADDLRLVRATLPPVSKIISSPARRCQQTAAALWPWRTAEHDAELWEQDFGAHDGMAYQDLPDLGVLSSRELAEYQPPGGESFDDLCLRVQPRLRHYAREAGQSGDTVALVVHAGVIRAALGQVVGENHVGIAFEIDPLSLTTLRCDRTGFLSVLGVNR